MFTATSSAWYSPFPPDTPYQDQRMMPNLKMPVRNLIKSNRVKLSNFMGNQASTEMLISEHLASRISFMAYDVKIKK